MNELKPIPPLVETFGPDFQGLQHQLTGIGIELRNFHSQFLLIFAILLVLLLASFALLFLQTLSARRVRRSQEAMAGQVNELQGRLQSIEKLLREVG